MDETLKRDQNFITVLGGVTDDADQDITMLRVDPITKRLLIKADLSGMAVTSLNGLTGTVILVAGTNINLGTIGNTITINATDTDTGITQLTGDVTAGPGSGSQTATLATVNSNVGSFGTVSNVGIFTVNGKGLITAASNTAILIAESQVTNLVTDLAGKQPLATNLTSLSGLSYASLSFVKMSASGTFSLDTNTYLTSSTGVTSVSGTTNRITSTGGTTPVMDISASYVGQSSITTVGTLSAGAVPTTLLTGVLQATQFPALTGDITTVAGALATTLATVNSNVGTFGSATQSVSITVNGKGLVTAISNVTVTPAVGSITGLGTGVSTALGVNVGTAGAFVVNGGALGTPSSGTGTNITGIPAGNILAGTFGAGSFSIGALTHTGNLTTSAVNIVTDTTTGTKFGTATNQKISFYNSTPIVQPTGDVITGLQNLGLMASATITATTNANLTGPITSVGNATSIASQTGTGTKFVVDTSPTIITPTFTTNFTSPIWKPTSNSTTALQINKADGTTNVINVDTTNSRLGVGTTTPDGRITSALSAADISPLFTCRWPSASTNFNTDYGGLEMLNTDTTNNNFMTVDFSCTDAGAVVRHGVGRFGVIFTDHTSGAPVANMFFTSIFGGAPSMYVMGVSGNVKIASTAARGTTEGTKHVDIFDGTAPVGTLANGNSLYSTNGILQAMDAAGNNSFVATVRKYGRSTAQTAAVATVATYTTIADSSFEISANVLVTASTLHNFTATVAYTDEGNTARTVTLQFSTLAGAFVTAMTNAQGTVPYEGVPLHIRAKASTAITIATTGTFTTVTYNVEGIIRQLQ